MDCTSLAVKRHLLRQAFLLAADTLDPTIFLFWSTYPVVSAIGLAMHVHEFVGCSFRSTEGKSVFVWLLSSNIRYSIFKTFTYSLA